MLLQDIIITKLIFCVARTITIPYSFSVCMLLIVQRLKQLTQPNQYVHRHLCRLLPRGILGFFCIKIFLLKYIVYIYKSRQQLQLAALKTTFDFVISDSAEVKMICRTGQSGIYSALKSCPCQSTSSDLHPNYGLTMLIFSSQHSAFQQDILLHQKVHFHTGTCHPT